MKKINTSTYYLFNISLLLEQDLHIQKQISEHLQDLNELSLYNNQKHLEDVEHSELTKVINKFNSNINDMFSYNNEIIPEVMQDISKYLKDNCNHEWVNDDIDLHLDKTIHIYYCNYCGISKNH
jgi:hypothetical protein